MISLDQSDARTQFEAFYEQYTDRVYHYLFGKLGNVQDAEELTSEIFEYCYRRFHTFDPQKASIQTWLFVIVNSRYKNFLRSRRCTENIEDYMEYTAADDAPLEQAIELEQERSALARALELLPDRQREIVIQKYFFEKSATEIGKMMGMTQVNVRVQLYRAIQRLKTLIEFEK